MAKILLIDDEDGVRKAIRELLEEAGHDVDEAANVDEGVERYVALHHDLIITDLIMPGLSGLDLIYNLKSNDPNLKIIAISGGGVKKDFGVLQVAGRFGADHMLTKPVLAEHLFEFVDDCLKQ